MRITASPKNEVWQEALLRKTGRKHSTDRSTVIYNGKITMTGIPDEGMRIYVVNGKVRTRLGNGASKRSTYPQQAASS